VTSDRPKTPTQAGAPRPSKLGRTPAKPRMSAILDRTRAGHGAAELSFSKTRHAYAVLRAQILDGALRPGDWLRLTQIARSLDLSEMPVREALRLLEKDGLVTFHLHRGAQVASLSFERALEITEVRMVLERAAALASIPLHDRTSIDTARAVLVQMEAVTDDLVKFAVRNREFAGRIYAKCPNSFLVQHIQDLWDKVWQYSSTAVFEVMRHRVRDTLAENRAICEGIRRGDTGMVEDAFDRRLRKSVEAWQMAIAGAHTRPATSNKP